MSTHPNAMILGILIPDELARKTYRAILEESGRTSEESIKIGLRNYSLLVMEDSYNEGYQISAPEGSIVAHDHLTYGYGETISWSNAEQVKNELEAWLVGICERHKCSYRIELTANYW